MEANVGDQLNTLFAMNEYQSVVVMWQDAVVMKLGHKQRVARILRQLVEYDLLLSFEQFIIKVCADG